MSADPILEETRAMRKDLAKLKRLVSGKEDKDYHKKDEVEKVDA